MFCICVSFVLEDSLEGKSIAMTAIAVYTRAASLLLGAGWSGSDEI